MKQIIEINIDSLTLHGISPHDKYRIADAVQTELTRLFTEGGLPASFHSGVSIPVMKGGSFNLHENAPATDTGNNIAGAVYKSL
jgi:hypothetical protein